MSKQVSPAPVRAAPSLGQAEGFYKAEGYGSQDSVGYIMRRVVMSLVNEVDRRLEVHDLTHAQWAPLFMLFKGRASTLAELARELQIDPGALTRTLDRLEAKGLCRRVRSTEDRRVSHLELTPDGLSAASKVPEVLSAVQNAYLKGFSVEEFEQLQGMLRRMASNAEAHKDASKDITG